MENRSNRGGSFESIGSGWTQYSHPSTPRMRTRYYEDEDQVLYSPNGDVIARVVDKAPKMGFRQNGER